MTDEPVLTGLDDEGVGFGATVLFHSDVVYLGESTKLRMPFASRLQTISKVENSPPVL